MKCSKCNGSGVVSAPDKIVRRPDGSEVRYSIVMRCSCRGKQAEAPPAPDQVDTQKRAAGDVE